MTFAGLCLKMLLIPTSTLLSHHSLGPLLVAENAKMSWMMAALLWYLQMEGSSGTEFKINWQQAGGSPSSLSVTFSFSTASLHPPQPRGGQQRELGEFSFVQVDRMKTCSNREESKTSPPKAGGTKVLCAVWSCGEKTATFSADFSIQGCSSPTSCIWMEE